AGGSRAAARSDAEREADAGHRPDLSVERAPRGSPLSRGGARPGQGRDHRRDPVTVLRTDGAVIGGGIVGLACARELALRGRRVAVLERDRVGEGCSFGNAGWLTPSQSFALAQPGLVAKATRWLFDPDSPFYVPLRADPFLAVWLLRFLWATRRKTFE